MRITIIGAGFTGLATGYYLSKAGFKVIIFEKDEKPGGLATGYQKKEWQWSLDHHYHHLFTSDLNILSLAKEVNHPVSFSKSKTSILLGNKIHRLDSPLNLCLLPSLKIIGKLRTAATLAYLKITPWWKSLENITSKSFLTKTMGKNSWEILWKPLFKGKFEKHAKKIPASWFWARIKKRSVYLGYPNGGFESLAKSIAKEIEKLGGKIYYRTEVKSLEIKDNNFRISYKKLEDKNTKSETCDKIISTLPLPLFLKITKELPSSLRKKLTGLSELGAVSLILRLKEPFFSDSTYWLNVNRENSPFLAIVEHTNLIPKKYYNDEHIVYIGKYLPSNHRYFSMTTDELLKEYSPHLVKINPHYKEALIGLDIFKAPFAQPIVSLNYSAKLPPIKTLINGLYLATMQHIYPWDRGTNYAVELGKKVAEIITKNEEKD
ncbi:NAD(P)/FAD-dependent oxidoreductase [Candidatus Woesebacteria bacterium]|nr:NAD(P)/FAD-dependent oxidoreductase [Candidatus Woesebacteria bacterium]